MKFKRDMEDLNEAEYIIERVYLALKEKGYNPVNQIVGYLLSGDPAYITSYKEARTMIRSIDRDEIIEELLTKYIDNFEKNY
ncbi:MAG TPA: IreB family regulatory phosphoprotein [Halanaerobiales bacterium]|nr:IreB family regulatory phosphoprotein [Halanaerobiales bacterium]